MVQSAEYVNYNSQLSALLDGNEKLQAVRSNTTSPSVSAFLRD